MKDWKWHVIFGMEMDHNCTNSVWNIVYKLTVINFEVMSRKFNVDRICAKANVKAWSENICHHPGPW